MGYLQDRLGYAGTVWRRPEKPTARLSQDIVREQHLLDQIVAYAGEARDIQMIPYATHTAVPGPGRYIAEAIWAEGLPAGRVWPLEPVAVPIPGQANQG